MGYYPGQRANRCPRCGGVVDTVFISVGPMSFSQRCRRCGTSAFTPKEEAQLGANVGPFDMTPVGLDPDPLTVPLPDPEPVRTNPGCWSLLVVVLLAWWRR